MPTAINSEAASLFIGQNASKPVKGNQAAPEETLKTITPSQDSVSVGASQDEALQVYTLEATEASGQVSSAGAVTTTVVASSSSDPFRDEYYVQNPDGTWSQQNGPAVELTSSYSFSPLHPPRVEILQDGNIVASYTLEAPASTSPGGAPNVIALETDGFVPTLGATYDVKLYEPQVVVDSKTGIPTVVGESLVEEISVTVQTVVPSDSYLNEYYSQDPFTGNWSLISGHAVEIDGSYSYDILHPPRVEILEEGVVVASYTLSAPASTAPGGQFNVVSLSSSNFSPVVGESYEIRLYEAETVLDSKGIPTVVGESLVAATEVTIGVLIPADNRYLGTFYSQSSIDGSWTSVNGHAVEMNTSYTFSSLYPPRVEIVLDSTVVASFFMQNPASTAAGGLPNVIALEAGGFVPVGGATYEVRLYQSEVVTDSKGNQVVVGEVLADEVEVTIPLTSSTALAGTQQESFVTSQNSLPLNYSYLFEQYASGLKQAEVI